MWEIVGGYAGHYRHAEQPWAEVHTVAGDPNRFELRDVETGRRYPLDSATLYEALDQAEIMI